MAGDVKVRRNGKAILWVQDTADTNAIARELRGCSHGNGFAARRRSGDQEIDYERIKEGTREVLAQEAVEVEVTVNQKE